MKKQQVEEVQATDIEYFIKKFHPLSNERDRLYTVKGGQGQGTIWGYWVFVYLWNQGKQSILKVGEEGGR